jgi:hypothetical protein
MSSKTTKKEVRIMRLTVYLPEDEHLALRHVALDERKAATKVVRGLIKEYLAKKGKRKGVK